MASSFQIKIDCSVQLAERMLSLLLDPQYSEKGNVVVKCRDGKEKILIRSIWRASSPVLGELLKEGCDQSGIVSLNAPGAIVDLLESCFHLQQKIEVSIAQIIPLFAASVRFKIDILTADLMESFTLGALRQVMSDKESWMHIDNVDMIHLEELLSQHELPSFDRIALTRNLLRWASVGEPRGETARKILEGVLEKPVEIEEAAQLGIRKVCYLRSAQVIRRIEFGRDSHSVTIDRRTLDPDEEVHEVFRLGLAYSIRNSKLCVRRATKIDGSTLGDERRFGLSYGDFDGICNSSNTIYVWRSQEIFIVDPRHERPPSKILDTTFPIGKVFSFVKDSRDFFGVSEEGTKYFHIIDKDGTCSESFQEFGDVKAISEHFALRQDTGLPFGSGISLVKFAAEFEIESSLVVTPLLSGWNLVDVMIESGVVLCLVKNGLLRRLLEIRHGTARVVLTGVTDSVFVRCID